MLASYSFAVVDALSLLTIASHALLAILIGLLITRSEGALSTWVSNHAPVLMLIVAIVATTGSLFFSEIAGWNPCKYCWIQRIFMYPQAILLGIALWKKDRTVARYILALSIVGAAYAAYHYYIQMYDIIAIPTNPATPCDSTGESCVKTPFAHFGYITIPMMALTAFALNIVGSAYAIRRHGPQQ